MENYTKEQAAAIDAAWRAIRYLCECTKWSDAPTWSDAEKLERREFANAGYSAATAARAMIVKGWAEGLGNPDMPARKLCIIRAGYLTALLLGVRHAVEQRGTDYTGPMVEEARALCDAAIAANEAHTRRVVEGVSHG